MTAIQHFTRRRFLQTGVAAGALFSQLPLARALGPNDEIRLGIVGCGWRGGQLKDMFKEIPGVRVAALCDADSERLAATAEGLRDVQKYTDMREMYDSAEIDAVAVAAPNHWHCLAGIWALQAGKHLYIEKPLGQTQWEARQLLHTAEKSGLVCQIGTQQRTDPMQAEIKKFLHQEKQIGAVREVLVNRIGVRESIGKREQPLEIPKSVNYDLWLGPAHDEPIYRNQLHYDWHWMWNTGSGEMGNWGAHILDDVRNNVFLDRVALPTRICGGGGRYAWNDAGETPNTHYALFDAGGIPVTIGLSNLPARKQLSTEERVAGPESGYIVYCEGGRLEGERGKGSAFDAEGKKIKEFKGTTGQPAHQENFIEAVRQGDPKLVNAPLEQGFYSTEWCNLANIAARVGEQIPANEHPELTKLCSQAALERGLSHLESIRSSRVAQDLPPVQFGPVLEIDPTSERFVGSQSQAKNRLLRREDREPYKVPEVTVS